METSPAAAATAFADLPLKPIPGDYGWPVLGAIKDRLDFFWFQGQTQFWTERMKRYNSTVFRVNVPPSPPGFPASKAIMLLDQKSFPVLFDTSKVEKKDMLLANYMPNTQFYGGIRPCVYLDPSEERHTKIKPFVMDVIKKNAGNWIPQTEKALSEVFPVLEEELEKNGKAEVNTQMGQTAFNVLFRTILGQDPMAPGEASLGKQGPTYMQIWLAPQLAPIASVGLPHLLEEILIHTFRIPYFLVSYFHNKVVKFVEAHGVHLLDLAETKYGIDRYDALHNIVFFLGFNAFGGLSLFYPNLIGYVGRSGPKLHEEIASEVREAVASEGGKLTFAALQKMELVKSVVWEALRMSPPVSYQYGKAKEDFIVESHDAKFEVKKGEIIGGCQPLATRDPVIFEDPDTFIANRFVGEKGEKLLRYVLWGNGPADGQPSVANKQCAAADLVPLLSQALMAGLFLRYDSFTTMSPIVSGNSTTHYFSSLTKTSSLL